MGSNTLKARPHRGPDNYKKNLRRINITVTAQTFGHLEAMAAANGWGEKDLGRVIDNLVRTAVTEGRQSNGKKY